MPLNIRVDAVSGRHVLEPRHIAVIETSTHDNNYDFLDVCVTVNCCICFENL